MGILVILALLAVAAVSVFFTLTTKEDGVTVTVSEKDRVHNRDSSYYLIWSEEGEVYKNSDSWIVGKFRSSDLHGRLEEGTTYTCTVAGVRIPILSTYRNLLDCQEAT